MDKIKSISLFISICIIGKSLLPYNKALSKEVFWKSVDLDNMVVIIVKLRREDPVVECQMKSEATEMLHIIDAIIR